MHPGPPGEQRASAPSRAAATEPAVPSDGMDVGRHITSGRPPPGAERAASLHNRQTLTAVTALTCPVQIPRSPDGRRSTSNGLHRCSPTQRARRAHWASWVVMRSDRPHPRQRFRRRFEEDRPGGTHRPLLEQLRPSVAGDLTRAATDRRETINRPRQIARGPRPFAHTAAHRG